MAIGDPCFGTTFERLKAQNEEYALRNEEYAGRILDLRTLFHRLWSQARESPDYEKEVWKEAEKSLW